MAGRKGVGARTTRVSFKPTPRPSKRVKAIPQGVANRTHELMREVHRAERWKASVSSKLADWTAGLESNKKLTLPAGLPAGIQRTIRRCFAQACLELKVQGLEAQKTSWYPAAAEAARTHMGTGSS